MKLSISWLLDHIVAAKNDLDIHELIKKFNATTAEVDAVEEVITDLSSLYAVKMVEKLEQELLVSCPELGLSFCLPFRKDPDFAAGFWYLIKKDETGARWATLKDIGSSKDGLLVCLSMTDSEAHGLWRDAVEQKDTLILIDNKAITNRPDLWGHRGCAREMAALLGKKLVQEDQLLVELTIKHFDKKAPASTGQSFEIALESDSCRRFSGLYLPQVSYRASIPKMAFRLARIDFRPIDALVDMTNYVMADMGQPMHAFDAHKLSSKKVYVRSARSGEKIQLLDGEEAILEPSDCVISDGDRAISVAGVMGGLETAVSSKTGSMFLESASFEPTTIRKTATRLKKRTESSTRYEKNLDPNQNTQGILRYLKLLHDAQIPYEAEESIVSLGHLWKEKVVTVSHELIQSKIGTWVSPERILEILKNLDFGVVQDGETYVVTVPTFRATKDVTIPEDIVEEVARFVGYQSLVPVLPLRKTTAFDTRTIEQKRRIKHCLAYGLAMHEVQTYAFSDEEFLKRISYDPVDAPRIANPLSEHWQRLITSLVPNLLSCVVTNQGASSLRFFEMNRVWFVQEGPVELQECAGIWYEKSTHIDFYEGKALVDKLFSALGITIAWIKPQKVLAPWYDAHQSAELWYEDRIIGRAGKAATQFLSQVLEGEAFIFELDANFLRNVRPEHAKFVPLPKYPGTEQDISMLIPRAVTVKGLEEAIAHADPRIAAVHLVDQFEKPEWPDKKSLTFRYFAVDPEGTLAKDDIELIVQHVTRAVQKLGAEVR